MKYSWTRKMRGAFQHSFVGPFFSLIPVWQHTHTKWLHFTTFINETKCIYDSIFIQSSRNSLNFDPIHDTVNLKPWHQECNVHIYANIEWSNSINCVVRHTHTHSHSTTPIIIFSFIFRPDHHLFYIREMSSSRKR